MHRTYSPAPDWPGSPHESLVVEHSVSCSAVNMLIINTQLSGLIMWNRTTITGDQGTNDILPQTRNSEQTCIYWHCITRKPVSRSIFSSDISCWFDFQFIFLWLFMYSLTDWFSPRYIFTPLSKVAHYCAVYCSLGDIRSSRVHEAQNIYAELFSLSTHSEWIHTSVSHPTESMLKTATWSISPISHNYRPVWYV